MLYRKIAVFCLSFICCISSTCYALNVTFINPGNQGEHFWDMVTDTMKAAAIDLDISLEVFYADRNRIQMQNIGISVTRRQQKPDVILIVNEEQASDWQEVMLGSLTPNNFGAGARMMEALIQCASEIEKKDSINLLMIPGDQLTPASIERSEGGLSILKQQPNVILHRFLFAN